MDILGPIILSLLFYGRRLLWCDILTSMRNDQLPYARDSPCPLSNQDSCPLLLLGGELTSSDLYFIASSFRLFLAPFLLFQVMGEVDGKMGLNMQANSK